MGTWKPHGGWIDVWLGDNAGVRRWMCKWCGLARYKNVEYNAFPSAELKWWVLEGDPVLTAVDLTPKAKCYPVNPWRG